jgi:glucose/arabinose dehydrogenase
MARRTRSIARALGIALAATLVVGAAAPAGAAVRAVKVAGGLDGPAAFTFTPKGTIVYLERASGKVRFRNPRTGFDRVFFNIKGVSGAGERGALGVALHPRWPKKPFVYVYVTRSVNGKLRNQVVRIKERRGRRDEGASQRLQILSDTNGTVRCHTAYNCTNACPRDIQITKAIGELKLAMVTGKLD